MAASMRKIRARHKGHRNIYVHNDLSNAAHHFKEQIEAKLKAGDREGIAFEYIACLVMLAFTFESKINFLGHKLISGWKERQPFNDKISEILDCLKLRPDWDKRPYSSLSTLKKFRDSIAHGKPLEIEFDEEIVLSDEELDREIDLDGEWVRYCSHDNVFDTYADVDLIWRQLLSLARLDPIDTITRGSSGLTYIDTLTDKAE
jgi:hypothetical protein